jgi:predicted MFS family arabinose efflux permease
MKFDCYLPGIVYGASTKTGHGRRSVAKEPLYYHTHSHYYAVFGMGVAAITYAAFGILAVNFNLLLMIVVFIFVGLGNSMFQSPNSTETMSALPPHKLGISSSVSSAVRNLGITL